MASGGRGYSGYGRGGRGQALLEALQAPVRRPGEAASETRPTAGTQPPPPSLGRGAPMGRGAMLQQMLAQGKPGASTDAAAPPAQPVPFGRGSQVAPPQAQVAKPPAPRSLGRGLANLVRTSPPQKQSPPQQESPPQQQSPPRLGRGQPLPQAQQEQVTQQMAEMSLAQPGQERGGGDGHEGGERRRLGRYEYIAAQYSQEPEAVVMRGTGGTRVDLSANYIRMKSHTPGVYQYAVSFSPMVDSITLRKKLFYEFGESLGEPRLFDGAILFMPHQTPQQEVVFKCRKPTDGSEVTMRVKLVRVIPHEGCVQLFNILFRKIMGILKLCPVGRHYYDPFRPAQVPQHKLEVWPGYITAVDKYEGGLMILADVSHRVLRKETVLDVLEDIVHRDRAGFRETFTKTIVGNTVLTRYNNKTYRVDDVDWTQSPSSTFPTQSGEKSYVQYYKEAYGKDIQDPRQPLLLHKPTKREQAMRRGRGLEVICLVPELCYMTGLTDDMRQDWRVMKDLASHTRISPPQRQASMRKFCENIATNQEARELLAKWGLELDMDLVKLDGRLLNPENIYFGREDCVTPRDLKSPADWGSQIGRKSVISGVDLQCWLLLYTRRDGAKANDFIQTGCQVSNGMGLRVNRPRQIELPNDKTETYIRAIKENMSPNVQLVVAIFPTSRDDRYNALKKLCCVDCPVPSQVIITKTISDQRKLRSVMQKVMLQINCKLGGELWEVKIPTKTMMVVGIDVYHDKSQSRTSIAGVVASLNPHCTRWFSRVCIQSAGQELLDGLKKCLADALEKYNEVNGHLPDKITVYRDGVGDGQLDTVSKYEVPQLATTFKIFGENYNPGLTMVVVQKRINTRLFARMTGRGGAAELDNPPPGTVMDHTITRKHWYDFFLVSQLVRQGTVSPTHYVVVHDTMGWPVQRVQQLAYKMTHLYYNWPGTVRVPAPCQYAHKLAYLVGQNLHKEPSKELADRLFFL